MQSRGQSRGFRLLPVSFDHSEWPTNRLDFYVLDSNGSRVEDLRRSDIRIADGGSKVDALSLSCPDPLPRPRLSSLLAIDVSSSMSNNGRIEIARSAARAWIQELDLGYSEAAVLAFDHEATLLHDFSSDRRRLLGALDLLSPRGGTSYDAGLLSEPFGALPLVSRGQQERVVVFLTDGQATGNFSEMIERARGDRITVHVVLLQTKAPHGLVSLAIESGGLVFDNVQDADEARLIFQLLLKYSRREPPCRLVWTSKKGCDEYRAINLEIPLYGVDWSATYSPPEPRLPVLASSTPHLAFGPQPSLSDRIMSVTLRAERDSVRIKDLTLSSEVFAIDRMSRPLPAHLGPGEELEILVRFQPSDSSYQFANLSIESDACFSPTVVVSGGQPGFATHESMRIVSPNGGEVYHTGQAIDITWGGVAASDTLLLEFSLDGGVSWQVISESATGLQHRWRVPMQTSDQALVRGFLLTSDGRRGRMILPAPDRVWSVAWSHDGSLVAVSSERGVVQLRNGEDGSLIQEFPSPDTAVVLTHVQFSPDGKELLLNSTGPRVYIRSLLDGSVRQIIGKSRIDRSLFTSEAGSIVSISATSGELYRHDRESLELLATYLIDLEVGVSELHHLPDLDQLLLAGADDSVRVVGDSDAQVVNITGSQSRSVQSLDLSRDRSRLLVSGLASEIELFTWPLLERLPSVPTSRGTRVARFLPDGESMIFSGSTRSVDRPSAMEIYDINRRETGRVLIGHTNLVTSIQVSPTSDRAVSGSWDSSAILWDLALLPSVKDASDQVFSIVEATVSIGTVDFGRVELGKSRDMIAVDFLCNRGTTSVTIDSIGRHVENFEVMSPRFPITLAPGECVDAEVSYRPLSAGSHVAEAFAFAGGYRAIGELRGVGYQTGAEIAIASIDFGEVVVGTSRTIREVSAVENRTSDTLLIDSLALNQSGDRYRIGPILLPVVLAPGTSMAIEYAFTPERRGYSVDRLSVWYHTLGVDQDSGIGTGSVVGEGVCGPSLDGMSLSFGSDLHAAPGGEIGVPIILSSRSMGSRPSGTYMMLISWDATLAALVATEGIERLGSGGRSFAIMRGEVPEDSDTLAILRLVAGLGRDVSTDLTIHQLGFASECDGGFELRDGLLLLDSICTDPETRLFFASDTILLRSVVPHPVRARSTISYRLIEAGPSTLELIDASGRIVQVLSRGERPPGEYLDYLDVDDLPSGRYFLRLRTETQDLLTPVVIQE